MLFGVWTRVGSRNHVLDGLQISPCEGAILRGKGAAHCKVHRGSTMSCGKIAELVEMPFGMWARVGPRNHVLDGSAH